MPLSIPDIDFRHIRPYGQPATRPNAFEEMASILIEQRDDWPADTAFFRFGNPDGGREGKGVLPNGDVWAWQAKYLYRFDASAAGQIKKSLTRTLENESTLTRYFVALPIDLPAGDTDRAKSAFTLWGEEVANWQALAGEHGLSVDFVYVGMHQMATALTEPRNAGRVRYWFDANILTKSDQQTRIDDTAAKLGRRYSPKLHVAVDVVQVIDAVGRSSSYIERWQHALSQLRSARQWGWSAPEGQGEKFDSALATSDAVLPIADHALQRLIESAQTCGDLASVEQEIDDAISALRALDELLHTHSLSEGGYYVGDAATLYGNVRKSLSALNAAWTLWTSTATRAAIRGELLLTGRAGVGKSHLLCDVARRRIVNAQPTILILGQEFDNRALMTQIPELGEFVGTTDDLLSLLDAAGEATGNKALLMIDAINESDDADRWADTIPALRTKAARYPHVGLVVSCRTEFVEPVVGTTDLPTEEHYGFEEATDTAVRRFASEYNLDVPTFPVFNPEFSNPLFLRLTCEALETLGTSRFVLGSAGLTTVCDAFVEATNKRLSGPQRCDYDSAQNLVQATIQQLAQLEGGHLDRADVARITTNLLPNRPWSKSLMKGLLDNSILIETGTDRIAFGYQRLGDVSRSKDIASRSLAEIEQWVRSSGLSSWRERGTLGALAIILPETHGRELIDVATVDNKVPKVAIDSYLESLILRDPTSVTTRTIQIAERLLDSNRHARETWSQIFRLACVPSHPMNGRWLHESLAQQDLAERDSAWSVWLFGATDPDEHSPVRTLIEWAWPPSLSQRVVPDRETGALAILALGWLLTTSDRRVRDQATKAMVAVGEQNVPAFVDAIKLLLEADDPYVIERVSAAACGIVLRNSVPNDVHTVADELAAFVADTWPQHLLTRDYIRSVFEEAAKTGWQGHTGAPPYGAAWPVDCTPHDEIEKLTAPPEYLYSSIWHSISGMGDFGKYILEPAIRDLVVEDRPALLELAERAIFDRVRNLGWSPERFDSIDRGLRRGRSDGPNERIGKKYQWIALYEVLGALADHFQLKPAWSSETPRPYEYPEQLIWRDLDVSVLARQPSSSAASHDEHWFSPAMTTFPDTIVDDYPDNMTGIPDPVKMLAMTDPDGTHWLSLLSYPKWKQHHPPEVEALRPPTRDAWMSLHAYLVPANSASALRGWAVGKDWSGLWMPDITENSNALLGSHPTGLRWQDIDDPDEWNNGKGGTPPTEFTQSGAWYGGTGTDRDASADRETQGFVPSRTLFEVLGLQQGVDFAWRDGSGVAVIDPSPTKGGPNVLLLRRDLVSVLRGAGFTLFWTVLAGHEHSTGDVGIPGPEYRWIRASASYLLGDHGIELIDSNAARYAPGPRKEFDVEWILSKSEN